MKRRATQGLQSLGHQRQIPSGSCRHVRTVGKSILDAAERDRDAGAVNKIRRNVYIRRSYVVTLKIRHESCYPDTRVLRVGGRG